MEKIAWTKEAIGRLAELAGEGLSGSEIASVLQAEFNPNITKNSVAGRAWRSGIRLGKRELTDTALEVLDMAKERIRLRKERLTLEKQVTLEEKVEPPKSPIGAVPINELKKGICHYPMWHDKTVLHSEKLYCGKTTQGLVYCPEHARICYSTKLGRWDPDRSLRTSIVPEKFAVGSK